VKDLLAQQSISKVLNGIKPKKVDDNKWYRSPWSEKPEKSHGSHDDGETVNVSEVTGVVCDMSIGLGAWRTSSGDHMV